jgi:hypothetical protein
MCSRRLSWRVLPHTALRLTLGCTAILWHRQLHRSRRRPAAGPGEQFITDGLELRRSGRDYPWLIRMTPPKPIKVILQDGENDLIVWFS